MVEVGIDGAIQGRPSTPPPLACKSITRLGEKSLTTFSPFKTHILVVNAHDVELYVWVRARAKAKRLAERVMSLDAAVGAEDDAMAA